MSKIVPILGRLANGHEDRSGRPDYLPIPFKPHLLKEYSDPVVSFTSGEINVDALLCALLPDDFDWTIHKGAVLIFPNQELVNNGARIL